jgi:hypothetical protein
MIAGSYIYSTNASTAFLVASSGGFFAPGDGHAQGTSIALSTSAYQGQQMR